MHYLYDTAEIDSAAEALTAATAGLRGVLHCLQEMPGDVRLACADSLPSILRQFVVSLEDETEKLNDFLDRARFSATSSPSPPGGSGPDVSGPFRVIRNLST